MSRSQAIQWAGAALLLATSGTGALAQQTFASQPPRAAVPSARTTVAGRRAAVAARAGTVEWRRTLAQQGYRDGLTLSGLQAGADQFFSVPDVTVRAATLHVDLQYDFKMYERAYFQVLVDDVPRRNMILSKLDDVSALDIALTSEDMRPGRPVKVSVRVTGALSDDRCYDQRIATGFVTILPSSALIVNYEPRSLKSVGSAWAALRDTIAMVLPSRRLMPEEYQSAWVIASALTANGHQIIYQRSADSMATWLTEASRGASANRMGGVSAIVVGDSRPPARSSQLQKVSMVGDSGVRVIYTDRGAVLAIGSAGAAAAANFVVARWLGVASGAQVVARVVRDLPGGADDGTMSFDELGIGTLHQELVSRAEWAIPFTLRTFTAGFIPSRLSLDVITARRASAETHQDVVHVFLNDVLLQSVSLRSSGRPQRIEVELPAHLVNAENTLRVVAQAEMDGGDCKHAPPSYMIQVLGSSVLAGTPAHGPVHDFLELSPRFGAGFETFLPVSYLDAPERSIPMLASLEHAVPSSGLRRVTFYPDNEKVRPTMPFIVVGRAAEAGLQGRPIELSNGRVVLQRSDGQVLLDVGAVRSTIVQLVHVGDQPGVWLATSGGAPLATPPLLQLDHGNVAFISNTGLDFALQTDRDRVVRVHYPGATSWVDVYSRYKYFLIGMLWLLLTGGCVYLVKQLGRQGRAE